MNRHHWIRIIGPLLLFGAVGTIGVLFLLNAAFQRQSHSEFVALADTSADFIRDTIEADRAGGVGNVAAKDASGFLAEASAAQNKFMADHQAQFSGVEVQFQRIDAPDKRHEVVTAPINSKADLTLIRERPRLRHVLLQPMSVATLTVFWTLWAALAWAVMTPSLNAQRFGLLGSIATSLAHELRNPIAAIRLHGQLLEKNEPTNASLIIHEAARIEDMLNQWMFLARPEPPRKTEVAPADLVGQVVRSLSLAASHASVRITVVTLTERRIMADAHRLGQVFHNIILNSIQAMPTGGSLTITISDRDIAFVDTGYGFSPTALRRAASHLYSEKEGGMGIGLNVARKIVRAHDGQLVLGNRPGGGAAVSVVL